MDILRSLLRIVAVHILTYALCAFLLFTTVASLVGGISDIVFAARAEETQDRWEAEALARGETWVRDSFLANTVTGIAQLVLFGCTVGFGILFFRKPTSRTGHVLLGVATLLCLFVTVMPRQPIGTASGSMREIYAFLTILGGIDLGVWSRPGSRNATHPTETI